MITSALISVAILWSGDFSARLQFDGTLQSEIKGEFIQPVDTQNSQNCEVFGHFSEVKHKEKSSIEKFLRIEFKFLCTDKGQIKTIRLAPELIRLSDLKTHSKTVFISEKFKKNSFKIENYSLQVIKSPSEKK